MPSEREFIDQRFVAIKKQREQIAALMGKTPHKVHRGKKIDVNNEYRLLGKILDEVPEGRVLKTLKQWRDKHCQDLQDHKKQTRTAQIEAERYWLEYDIEPEQEEPSQLYAWKSMKIKDTRGYSWTIDDRYIRMMDRMIDQLEQWLV